MDLLPAKIGVHGMLTAPNDPRVAVVIIGRNEGDRLRRCLQSAMRTQVPLVYVDSGSMDGSAKSARALGVDTVELDASCPFTAARGRNAGVAHLLERWPQLDYVQFLDGDCELCDGWLQTAVDALCNQPGAAAVCGRVCERQPGASIYNRICHLEWRQPIGEVDNCGGNSMMRVPAFQAVRGFNADIIAAEDTELCTRLRLAGWRIVSLDAHMVYHDADMMHFGQWFRRAMRSGHALTEGAVMHGRSPARLFVRASRRIALFGVVLPLVGVVLAWPTGGAALLVLLVYPALLIKTYLDSRRAGDGRGDALIYAGHCVAAKFPQGIGQLIYWSNRLRGRRTRIIEHRRVARDASSSVPPRTAADRAMTQT